MNCWDDKNFRQGQSPSADILPYILQKKIKEHSQEKCLGKNCQTPRA